MQQHRHEIRKQLLSQCVRYMGNGCIVFTVGEFDFFDGLAGHDAPSEFQRRRCGFGTEEVAEKENGRFANFRRGIFEERSNANG